jgi:hypothetical protein
MLHLNRFVIASFNSWLLSAPLRPFYGRCRQLPSLEMLMRELDLRRWDPRLLTEN